MYTICNIKTNIALSHRSRYEKNLGFLLTIAIGLILWFLPIPQGVTPEAWHVLAVMVATIAGFIFIPLPIGYVAIFGITAVISLKYANGLRNGANSDTHRCKQLTEHGEERCIKLKEVAGFSAVRTIFQIVGPRKILHCLLGK